MKLLALLGLVGYVSAAHPIATLVEELKTLQLQAKEDGEKEALSYQKFSHWCGVTTETLQGEISTNKDKISNFEDEIKGLKATAKSLESEIQSLEDEIAKNEAAQSKADGIRADELAIYEQKSKDLESTVSAIGTAIESLKASKSVLQVRSVVKKAALMASASMTHSQRQVIHSFLQQPEEIVTDPKANRVRKYDFKSGNVIELLGQLKEKFEEDLLATKKAENNAVNSHELSTQALTAATKAATEAKDEKTKILGETKASQADTEGFLADEQRELEMNTEELQKTTQNCRNRSVEYESRSKSRADEIAAITEAIKIIGEVMGVRTSDHEIKTRPASFIQLSNDDLTIAKKKAVALINAVGTKHHNGMIQRLSQQIKIMRGPFQQIKNAIQKMIFRLNKEQTDEDAHKNWCDTELETTTQQRDEKQDVVEKLTTKKNELTSLIEQLTTNLSEIAEKISETNKYMKDETEMRVEHKADNEKTIADAKEAQAALAQGIKVLTEYYKDSGAIKKESWEFVQEPELGYSGDFQNTSGSDKVLALITTTLEDYTKLEAETVAAEESEETNYEEDMKANKIMLRDLTNEEKMKTARKTQKEEEKAATVSQLKKQEKSLEALEQYLKDLDQPCVAGDSTYGDRKQARNDEIDALKEALNLLADAFKPKSFLAMH